MFPVTVVAMSRNSHPFHDGLGVGALSVFLFDRTMAPAAIDTGIRGLFTPFRMGIISDPGVAVPTEELSVDRFLQLLFGYKKGDLLSGPLFREAFVLVTSQA